MATTLTPSSIPVFAWKPQYSVGIREIDLQHQKLVSLLADLHTAMSEGKGAAAVDKIVQDLITYTRIHLESEERLMAANGYPGLAAHKQEHAKLTNQVVEFYNRSHSGNPSVAIELMLFLKEWLVNHILHTDKNYGPFLNAKGVR